MRKIVTGNMFQVSKSVIHDYSPPAASPVYPLRRVKDAFVS